MIRTWTELAPLRTALRNLGYAVHITAVDFEPALNAALARTAFDAVVYDPATPGITREMVDARAREHGRDVPVIELTSEDTLADQIVAALTRRMN